jgi:plasmid stabilization system protein ParE
MGCKIIFSPQAISDLESAVRFIARHNPEAAMRVGDALIERVAVLENFPLIGLPYP